MRLPRAFDSRRALPSAAVSSSVPLRLFVLLLVLLLLDVAVPVSAMVRIRVSSTPRKLPPPPPKPTCDLCRDNWLFVLGAGGRTGTTTAMAMLDAIPGIEIAGEHDALLEDEKRLYHKLLDLQHRVGAAWKHRPLDRHYIKCSIQERTKRIVFGSRFDSMHKATKVFGFKEIRYLTLDTLKFIDEVRHAPSSPNAAPCSLFFFFLFSSAFPSPWPPMAPRPPSWHCFLSSEASKVPNASFGDSLNTLQIFPCARYVFTYRKNTNVAVRAKIFGQNFTRTWEAHRNLFKVVHGAFRDRTAMLAVENLNPREFTNVLQGLVGAKGCSYNRLVHSNSNGGYTDQKDLRRITKSLVRGKCDLSDVSFRLPEETLNEIPERWEYVRKSLFKNETARGR